MGGGQQLPRQGLTSDAVVAAAIADIDERGADAFTLAAVAKRCGVAPPSLYKHVPDLARLRRLVSARVLTELTKQVRPAVTGRSGYEALAGLMRAWRDYALAHPYRYAAMTNEPLSDPAQGDAGVELLEVLLAVLEGYGLTGSEAIHQARCVRAVVHGFASIEVAGGFGLAEDVDISYERLIHLVAGNLAAAR